MTPAEITELAAAIGEELAMYHKDTLTTEEAARYLGLAKNYLHKLMMQRVIPYFKPNGKNCYFRRADLDEWMQRGRTASYDELDARARAYCAEHKLPERIYKR